ncbi:YhcB family protein [Truepera radiovictrix]|uniref:Z-ring associated protein G n=1 Tax=Truepera radiovictrix (strain DSM 17093 / CIP 108686 / LMG 22925 / RQ-24) TaxID=649638 RepID=D7CVN7_TRURR|nr:DUF1043 family protein [Truepera radiovictrix]ADI15948.1 protein of unknown function DUF1043 [Truepera radiovictrix DSM 17093]WMT58425.1 DUF1043 family protein [Truepera radiovictrix]
MYIENFWLFVIVVMSVGAILGFSFFSLRYRNSKRIEQLQQQLEAKTEELANYRGDVNEHFLRTAELIDELTKSYKLVYDHLESGAYRLVGEETFRQQLAERKQPQLAAFSTAPSRELGAEGERTPLNAAALVIEEDLFEPEPVAKRPSGPPEARRRTPAQSPRAGDDEVRRSA